MGAKTKLTAADIFVAQDADITDLDKYHPADSRSTDRGHARGRRNEGVSDTRNNACDDADNWRSGNNPRAPNSYDRRGGGSSRGGGDDGAYGISGGFNPGFGGGYNRRNDNNDFNDNDFVRRPKPAPESNPAPRTRFGGIKGVVADAESDKKKIEPPTPTLTPAASQEVLAPAKPPLAPSTSRWSRLNADDDTKTTPVAPPQRKVPPPQRQLPSSFQRPENFGSREPPRDFPNFNHRDRERDMPAMKRDPPPTDFGRTTSRPAGGILAAARAAAAAAEGKPAPTAAAAPEPAVKKVRKKKNERKLAMHQARAQANTDAERQTMGDILRGTDHDLRLCISKLNTLFTSSSPSADQIKTVADNILESSTTMRESSLVVACPIVLFLRRLISECHDHEEAFSGEEDMMSELESFTSDILLAKGLEMGSKLIGPYFEHIRNEVAYKDQFSYVILNEIARLTSKCGLTRLTPSLTMSELVILIFSRIGSIQVSDFIDWVDNTAGMDSEGRLDLVAGTINLVNYLRSTENDGVSSNAEEEEEEDASDDVSDDESDD